ncbi:MAG: Uma2 family endonuclease [Bacillota bacterium]|nr:Uma2 family endonuclease [Bacillota bacterium]
MPLPKEEHYTLADALTWDENERIELIDGVPYMMAPPVREHQRILMELARQIGNYLAGKKCEVYPAPFAVRLFEQASDEPRNVNTMVEPDISVVCDPDKLDKIGCRGAPDFIVEILSPSTQRHDRLTKYNLYQQAGVREYWIVDPELQTVQVFVLEDRHFQAFEFYNADAVADVKALPGCRISLSDVFGI